MKLKVCVAGATGWVGKPLCAAVSAAEDLTLVGAVSRTHRGRDAECGAGPHIQGALLAIRGVSEHVGLVRGLDRIMS